MRGTRTVRLILAVFAVLAVAAPAPAQTQIGGFGIEGNVDAGWRFLPDEPSKSRRAKWEEYRDFPSSAFLGDLQLRFFRPDQSYAIELGGSKWGQQDQEFSLGAGRLGLWEFGFSWDQTPHVFSTNARFLATETSRGVFTLTTPRPPLAAHNSAPTLDEISLRWDTAKVFFTLTPTPDLDITAAYTRIRKEGNRPLGMAMGSPGNNFYEILEPIEQTIHDFRIKGTWATENWQLQFGYTLSVFQNDLDRVRADNPCFGAVAPAGCGANDPAAPATGQTSLPPDNMAHTITIGGGVNLPMRTRVNANFSYGLALQNADFLPHTINPALAANPSLVLPQTSLNGNAQTILFNLGVTSRPIRDWTFSAKYRLFDLMDRSDVISFAGLVVNDRSLSGARTAGRWDYQRQNADADARWQIIRPLAITLGGGWEHWSRNEHREVPDSDEYFAKLAVDTTPFEWLLARLTYRPSFRRISNYNARAHAEHTVGDEDGAAVSQGQSILLRKFDEAERNRQQVDLSVNLMPLESLTITPTASYKWDDYLKPAVTDPAGGTGTFLGVDTRTSWSAGMDVGWAPWERVSFSAGYMHEVNYQRMDSRSRPVIGGFGVDFFDYTWISNITDTIDTAYAGVKTVLIPDMLDLRFNASYSYALGTQETRNITAPVSSTAANNFSASAKRMPAFEDELIRLEAALSYHFLKNWTARLGYAFESFTKHDWRTDGLDPFTPAFGNSIWLGNDLRSYTAHIVTAAIGYRFK